MDEPHIIFFGGKEYIPKEYFDEYCKRSISWSIDDLEQVARQLEEVAWDDDDNCTFDFDSEEPVPEQLRLYDRSKFQENLYDMIDNYDSDYGITWHTIGIYLKEYCKL